ncbi:SDR family oxidoreductase [Marivirga sp.]|uniref:SDR family oxidoreductase n=1 Tax=Marivirga sp. TaxID=2018662 RepID=UPI003DA70996
MDLDLSGKRVLVGGSTAGIGKAIAHEFAKEGANVTLIARDKGKLEATLNELSNNNQEHHFLVADYSHPESLREIALEYCHKNPIDILINNTGGPSPGQAHEALGKDYLNAFQQHLICNQYLAQAVIPQMKTAEFGRIINIISTSVRQPIPNLGVSNTVRGAVASWSKTISNELGPYGITVNNVLPGATMTGRLEGIIQNKSKTSGKSLDEVSKEMQASIPTRRFAEPVEVANAVLFLASEKASYINGVNLAVDGGRLDCI